MAHPGEPSPYGPGNPERPTLRYLFLRFLRYGFLAWGGPVAQIGLMHQEVVARDAWVSEERFRKVLALYQALPGPEATELAVYFGMLKRGRIGGLLTGLAFILPGITLLTLLALLYVALGSNAAWAGGVLYGFKPAVIALIALAVLRLTRASVTSIDLALVAVGVAAVALLAPQVNFLLLLALAGAAALAAHRMRRPTSPAPPRDGGGGAHAAAAPLALGGLLAGAALGLGGYAALLWVFLKAGMLSFGGAYTSIPFIQEGIVAEHRWITGAQFLDALALSALVPGPLIAVGTFVGFLAAGLPGAVLATVGVFAPAFAFTLLGHAWFERIVDDPRLHAFLLGVTAGAIGLIVASTVPLARAALVDPWTVAIALGAAVALHRFPGRIPFVLAAAGVAGVAVQLLV